MTETGKVQDLARQLYRAARMIGGGPANRDAGLDALRNLAVAGHRSALLMLAVELALDAPEAFVPKRDPWAHAALRAGHPGPLLRLIARCDMAGDTQGADLLRSRYRSAADAGLLPPGDDSVLQQAIGLIHAGDTHYEFGLKQLAALAMKGHQAAGLMLADELAESAPAAMYAGRQGWAEAAGRLGHLGPLLKLIVRGEQDGEPTQALRDIYVTLVDLPASDASVTRASGEAGKKHRENVPPGAKPEKAEGTGAQESARPSAGRAAWRRLGEVLTVLLLFGIVFAGFKLYERAPVRDWFAANLSQLTSTVSELTTRSDTTPEVSPISAPARAALVTWAERDETEADAALAAGRAREADDAIVRAIESALVAGDFVRLERLLDRQLETAGAIEVAKREEERQAAKEEARKNEIEYLLERIIGFIESGAEYTMEGSTGREITSSVSFDVSLTNSDLPCTLHTRQAYNKGNPERILALGDVLPAWSDVDLYDLYRAKPKPFNANWYHMVGGCPEYVLDGEGIIVSFCSGKTVDTFRSVLKHYLELTGCMR